MALFAIFWGFRDPPGPPFLGVPPVDLKKVDFLRGFWTHFLGGFGPVFRVVFWTRFWTRFWGVFGPVFGGFFDPFLGSFFDRFLGPHFMGVRTPPLGGPEGSDPPTPENPPKPPKSRFLALPPKKVIFFEKIAQNRPVHSHPPGIKSGSLTKYQGHFFGGHGLAFPVSVLTEGVKKSIFLRFFRFFSTFSGPGPFFRFSGGLGGTPRNPLRDPPEPPKKSIFWGGFGPVFGVIFRPVFRPDF